LLQHQVAHDAISVLILCAVPLLEAGNTCGFTLCIIKFAAMQGRVIVEDGDTAKGEG
jgi:hypothetical protein